MERNAAKDAKFASPNKIPFAKLYWSLGLYQASLRRRNRAKLIGPHFSGLNLMLDSHFNTPGPYVML